VIPSHDGTGKQYGLQSILSQRGMWPAAGLTKAQAMEIVKELPDFKNQLPWIKETVRNAGLYLFCFCSSIFLKLLF
jgi:hypothetical protein